MNITGGPFPSIEQVTDSYLKQPAGKKTDNNDVAKSFSDVFDSLKFSKHASSRLKDRDIELTGSQIDRLNAGMQKANEKGINESLVLMDQMAFIVNVKNSTVITAMNETEIKDNVFTNIDGAVIV
ncbi:MAG TPA: flagellar protein [Lachnospiraceae bacterium]|nr:flagellar protein [Lachnospiraceae bacterium]